MRADFVWTPLWGAAYSTFELAKKVMPVGPDPRARVYYDVDLALAKKLGPSLGTSLGVDVYLIYDAGMKWGAKDSPGAPSYTESKIGVGKPFTKETFAAAVKAHTAGCAAGVFDADTKALIAAPPYP